MGAAEKFCLRWNDFESNISSAFRELRDDKDFFDVTLACEDSDQLQAHKVILSACSPFFRTVLRRHRHDHPLLYLKGVKYLDLVAVLNFMYHGEVNVAQEELNSFLAVAEDLKVKGLTQGDSSNSGGGGGKGGSSSRTTPPPSSSSSSSAAQSAAAPMKQSRQRDQSLIADRSGADSDGPPVTKRPRPAQAVSTTPSNSKQSLPVSSYEDDDIQEVVMPVKSEPGSLLVPDHHHHHHHHRQNVTPPDPDYHEHESGGGSGQLSDPATMEYGGDEYTDYEGAYEGDGSYDDVSGGGLDQSLAGGADGNKALLDSYMAVQVVAATGCRKFACTVCQKVFNKKDHLKNHVEAIHLLAEYPCSWPACSNVCKSQPALRGHIRSCHEQQQQGHQQQRPSSNLLYQYP